MQFSFLYPGQGAQYPGMGKDLYDHSSAVQQLFKKASEHATFDVTDVIFNGSEEDLKSTDKTQIAITLVNIAAAQVLREEGIEADRCGGFSLGEYAALVEAGVLSADDVFPVVLARGTIMEKVSRTLDTAAGKAGMAAVLGLDFETVKKTVQESGIADLYPGINNSPVQTVLSGTADALSRAEEVMKSAGARRVIPLKVSGPFHSPLMQQAREEFGQAIKDVTFSDPVKPVYSNVTGKQITSGAEARELCLTQLVSTVLWVDEEAHMVADGSSRFVEVGPGTVLGGLWKAYTKTRDDIDYPCLPAGKLEEIKTISSSAS